MEDISDCKVCFTNSTRLHECNSVRMQTRPSSAAPTVEPLHTVTATSLHARVSSSVMPAKTITREIAPSARIQACSSVLTRSMGTPFAFYWAMPIWEIARILSKVSKTSLSCHMKLESFPSALNANNVKRPMQQYCIAILPVGILPIYTVLSNLVFRQNQKAGPSLFLSIQTLTFQTSSNISPIAGCLIIMNF